jgi:hypothetical protein
MKGAVLTFDRAHIENGRRSISASIIEQPGKVGSCDYVTLWVEMKEGKPFDAEPWTTFTRRPGQGFARESLPDKTRAIVRAEVDQALRVYGGFEKAWYAARHDPKKGFEYVGGASEKHADGVVAVLPVLGDPVQRSDVVREHGDRIQYVPVPSDDNYRYPSYLVPSERDGGTGWTHAIVQVLLDGEQIGWLDSGGKILPLADMRRREMGEGELEWNRPLPADLVYTGKLHRSV